MALNARLPARLGIFLVHGTFASLATWTRPETIFRTQLAAALTRDGHVEVCFESVDWSGGNSHQARRAGAVTLERRLRDSLRRQPDAYHFVVGHSHGGNIALRAAKRVERCVDRRIAVVTLATPFLRFRKVHSSLITWPMLCLGFTKTVASWLFFIITTPFVVFGSLFRTSLLTAIGYLVFLAVAAFASPRLVRAGLPVTPGHALERVCSFVSSEGICDAAGSLLNLLLVLVGSVLSSVFAWFVARGEISWQHRRSLVQRRRTILRRYGYSQPEPAIRTRVFAMSSAIDEALAVLSGAWLAHRVVGWMARAFSIAVVAGAISLAAFVLWRLNRWLFASNQNPMVVGYVWEGLDYLLPIGGVVIAAAVALATHLLTKVAGYSNLGLGLANPDHNLLWTVRAHRVPGTGLDASSVRFGLWEVLHGSGLLFHSRLYTHAPAIQRIAEWMGNECAARGRSQPADSITSGRW